jgi:uncharacterized protein
MLFEELLPFQNHEDDLFLWVRAVPNSAKPGFGKMLPDASGQMRLKVAIREKPIDGAANRALIRLISAELDIPPSRILCVKGETHRDKTLLIRQRTPSMMTTLRQLALRS